MRCPKCQYISFDNGERCRNCGYEFSLTPSAPAPDLPIQTGEEAFGPLADLALDVAPPAGRHEASVAGDAVAAPARPITASFDLPLFKESPRVTPAARPPLSVRRSTPTPPRSSSRTPEEPVLGFGFDEPSPSLAKPSPPSSAIQTEADDGVSASASFGPRILAALIDAGILSVIGLIVLYLTLRVCGAPWSKVTVIPQGPFAGFLMLIVGGYLTLFTAAGGQTIGKMASGIRVVPIDRQHGRVPLGHAVLRAAAYVASVLPAGLGFLPVLFGADKRAIHDRLAATRVVKA